MWSAGGDADAAAALSGGPPLGVWSRLVLRLIWLMSGLLVLVNAAGIVPGLAQAIRFDPWYALVGALFALGQYAGCRRGLQPRWGRPWAPTTLVGCTLAGLYLAALLGQPHAASTLWWPGIQLFMAAACGACALANRAASDVFAVAIVVAGAPALFLGQALTWPVMEATLATLIQAVALAVIVGRSLRGFPVFGAAADAAAHQRQLLDHSLTGDNAARLRFVHRFVHDEVLHTLSAISMTDSQITDAEANAEAACVLTRLSGPVTTGAGELADLREALEKIPTRLGSLTWQGARPMVPTSIAVTLTAAAAEAVRNVERHAHTDGAAGRVSSDSLSVTVEIVDDGVGFRPEQRPEDRHGLTGSIQARMDDIDGTATIASAPGVGTTVTLVWGPQLPTLAGRYWGWVDDSVKDLIKWMLRMFAPVPIAAALICVLQVTVVTRPGMALLGGFALVALYVCGAKWGLRDRLTGWLSLLLVVAAPAIVLIGALATATGDTSTAHQPLSGASDCLLVLMIAFRPAREAALATAAVFTAMCWLVTAHMGILFNVADSVPMLLSALVGAAVAFGIRYILGTTGRHVFLSEDTRRWAMAAQANAVILHAEIATHLDTVAAGVTPLLSRISAEPGYRISDQDRREASQLETQLRQDVSLGYAPATRTALRRLHRCEVPVTVRMTANPPGPVDDAIAAILSLTDVDSVGSGHRRVREMTVTVLPDGNAHRVSVVLRPAQHLVIPSPLSTTITVRHTSTMTQLTSIVRSSHGTG
ncbi:sensor histidine kinase [Leekyejoonella antrihumi]|uniref:Histidine kinase/HSP90-like ATPase domain-containing protein n=1 Tax=Leekyejoonella antrihumi TaxID=1660198 RepID=A0A563DST8_9MICO|nr:hypothetical protein [Leekyejoonella antrihumi]TWP33001.1 hypothetical protein FGL98_22665 [Leekyejoonella antrihumi]